MRVFFSWLIAIFVYSIFIKNILAVSSLPLSAAFTAITLADIVFLSFIAAMTHWMLPSLVRLADRAMGIEQAAFASPFKRVCSLYVDGSWVGGLVTITETQLVFRASPIKRIISGLPEDKSVLLSEISKLSIEKEFLTDIVHVEHNDVTSSYRCFGAMEFLLHISAACAANGVKVMLPVDQ